MIWIFVALMVLAYAIASKVDKEESNSDDLEEDQSDPSTLER